MPADLLMEPLAEARAGLALVLRAVQAIAVVVVEEHRCVPGRTIEDRIAVSPHGFWNPSHRGSRAVGAQYRPMLAAAAGETLKERWRNAGAPADPSHPRAARSFLSGAGRRRARSSPP
jgi:hypothetical protein